MYNQRLTRYTLRGDTCEVCQPVVGVDNIELALQLTCYLGSNYCVAGNLLHKVCTILTREGVTLCPTIALTLPELLTRTLVLLAIGIPLLGRDVRNHIRINMDERNLAHNIISALDSRVAITSLDIAGIDNLDKSFVLVARCFRHHEDNLDIVARQASGHTVTSRTQATGNMRRELPAKH